MEKRPRYKELYLPKHPMADKSGKLGEHRFVMANHLGRMLLSKEVVHHKDHNTKNNKIENLEILSASEHSRLHALEKPAQRISLVCLGCGQRFLRRKRAIKKGNRHHYCSNECANRVAGLRRGKITDKKHGTYNCYRRGCRCQKCKDANALRARKQRNKRD